MADRKLPYEQMSKVLDAVKAARGIGFEFTVTTYAGIHEALFPDAPSRSTEPFHRLCSGRLPEHIEYGGGIKQIVKVKNAPDAVFRIL